MSLRVYNTLTRKKELFEAITPGRVGIYLCGPTVYKPSHIGHMVGPVIFDSIKRYLVYKGYDVKLVINITDADEKLTEEAAKQQRPWQELARELEEEYKASLEALGVRGVDAFPRATDNMDTIIALVGRLVEKGAAYVVDGDVYFDHTQATDYGKLSGRRVEEGLSGTRELASKGRHPADFAVWIASKPGEPAWKSPWGKGRPGWHIECSAMSMAILGETFDIHGGGMDLIFPHHENEIAQSEAATGKMFAKYWLHNGLLEARRGQKMSKSLGNIRPIAELLEKYAGETIRAFVLSTHYRRPLEFSEEQLDSTARSLETFHRLFERLRRATGTDVYAGGRTLQSVHALARTALEKAFVKSILKQRLRFHEAMDDDFNTAGAIAALHEMAGTINRYIEQAGLEAAGAGREQPSELASAAGVTLVQTGRILGLFESPPPKSQTTDAAEIERLVAERDEARKAKDFARADEIRDQLGRMGVSLEDTPGGTVWRKS